MKKELYEYSVSNNQESKTEPLTCKGTFLLAVIIAIMDLTPIVLLAINNWLISLIFSIIFIICLVSIFKEKDDYAKRILAVFTWIFFMMMSGALLTMYMYDIPSGVVIISFLIWLLIYEGIFVLKLIYKQYSLGKKDKHRYKKLGALSVFSSICVGRILVRFFDGVEWFPIVVAIFLTFMATVAISYLQKYLVYIFIKKCEF